MQKYLFLNYLRHVAIFFFFHSEWIPPLGIRRAKCAVIWLSAWPKMHPFYLIWLTDQPSCMWYIIIKNYKVNSKDVWAWILFKSPCNKVWNWICNWHSIYPIYMKSNGQPYVYMSRKILVYDPYNFHIINEHYCYSFAPIIIPNRASLYFPLRWIQNDIWNDHTFICPKRAVVISTY